MSGKIYNVTMKITLCHIIKNKYVDTIKHIGWELDSLELMCGPGQLFFIKHGQDKPKEWTL